MKNISVVLLECTDFNEILGKTQQVSGDISRNEWFFSGGDSKVRSSYWTKVVFQLIMQWCHAHDNVQPYAKCRMPVLLTMSKACFDFSEFWVWLRHLNSNFEVWFPFLLKSMEILSLTSDARSREFRLDWTKRNRMRIWERIILIRLQGVNLHNAV